MENTSEAHDESFSPGHARLRRYPSWSRPGKVAYDPPTQYVYTSLIKPSLQIRLLRLHPAPETYNSVQCTLVAFTLDEIPEYEALSYIWGDPGEHGHEIFVDQSPFVVRPNLGNAMKRMRDESQGRWIWIDAICINMDDLAERNAQISLMRTIFSKASQVIVWLGEPSPRDLPAIEALKHPKFLDNFDVRMHAKGIVRLSLAPILGARPAWMPNLLKQTELYTRNLDHIWFTRVWAVQEYVLAQKVVFQWGSTILDSIALTDNVNRIVNAISLTRVEQQQEEVGTIMNHLRGFRYFSWVRRKWDKNAEDITAFARVVTTAQELYATNPRDKIFGLLALAPSSLRDSYRPDYASTVDDVYLGFALAMSLATRVKAVVDSIEQIDLSDGDTVVPDWLPGWIDELSLRVSDLLREPTLITGTVQSAVLECLEIVAINDRPRFKEVRISSSERHEYAESLRNASDALRSVLSQFTSTEFATLTTSTKSAAAPSTLHSVADDFSDSGYSSASSSAENTYLVASEIASHLVSHSYLRRLLSAAQKLEDRDDVLESYIRPCIRHLGQQLDTMASDFEELLVAKELKRHAPFIARALIARLRGFDIDEDQDIKIQRVSRIQRLLDEEASKLQSRLPSRLHEISTDENPRSARYPYGTDSSDGTGPPLQTDLPKTALEKVKEFLTTESAFMSFLYSIQYVIYSSPLEIIESEVEHLIRLKAPARTTTLREKSSSYEITVPLKNEAFAFESQAKYERFRHSLSISGNGKHCYATSCETYLKWAWPVTSHYLPNALSRERSPESSGHLGERNPKIEFSADSSIDSKISVTIDIVNNEKEDLIQIAQQLAWLTAACRRPVFGKLILSDILVFVTDEETLQISTLPVKEVVRHDEACWIPLFSGSVIAHRWPIPLRDNEIGIELPFHLMTALVGPLYPMKFDGGFCLKVHSRILFPTAVTSGGSRCVQWHYENKPGVRVAPPWYQKDEGDWDQIKRLETRRIVEARTFLGFCRKAVVDLGTEKSTQYYKNILYSGLEDEDHSLAVGVPTSITLGTGSLLPMTLTASVPIIRNKAQLLASDLERDYIDILDEAQERPVILYDTNGTSRGWMVPLSCVLLHMVHTWSAKKATFAEEYPQIGLTSNSGVAARDVLLDKWNFVVRRTINTELQEDKLVRDLVIQFWKDICQKQFQDLLAMSQEDYSYELQTEKLFGWEYMDVVDGRNSRRKQLAFKTNWGMFREQCIILFSQNLGDVILPADDVRICGKWRNVPTKRMHLTATVDCLTTLAYQNGGQRDTLTTFRLTNKGYWHYMPEKLFLDCEDSEQHTCLKKLQFLHSTPPESSPRLVPPSEGAVVFGRRKLEKPGPPVVTSSDIGFQSNRRWHRFNLFPRTRDRIRTSLERVASGSTTTPSSHEASDPLLSSGDISDDS